MRITDKIHCLRIDFSVGEKISRFVNIYIIFGDKIYMIDTGIKGCLQEIKDYIERNGRKITEIDSIFLTHSHPDHIGELSKIKKITNAKTYCSNLEKDWVENIDKQFQERAIPDFYKIVGESSKIDYIVEDGNRIKLEENITLKCIFTPGHSNGSFSYYFEEEKVIFTGDLIPVKKDRNMPVFENSEDLISSIINLKDNYKMDFLCSSWDNVKKEKDAKDTMDYALDYIDMLKKSVNKNCIYNNIEEISKKVFEECNIENPILVPIVIKSIKSFLKEKK